MSQSTMIHTDVRVATVEAHLEGRDGIRLSEKRSLGAINICQARVLTRYLHEGCHYRDADQIRPENFGRLTFAELAQVDLGRWNRGCLEISVGWVLDDLLELLMDDGWDIRDSSLQLSVH